MLSLPIAITTQPPRPHLGGGEARGLLTSLGMFPSLSLPLLPPSSVQGCCGDEVLEEMSCRVLGCPGVSWHAQGARVDRTSDLGTPHSSPFHPSSWHVSSVVHSLDPPCLLEDSATTPLVPRSTAKATWCPWGCSTCPCHQHWCPAMLPCCVPAVGGEHLAPGISQDLWSLWGPCSWSGRAGTGSPQGPAACLSPGAGSGVPVP